MGSGSHRLPLPWPGLLAAGNRPGRRGSVDLAFVNSSVISWTTSVSSSSARWDRRSSAGRVHPVRLPDGVDDLRLEEVDDVPAAQEILRSPRLYDGAGKPGTYIAEQSVRSLLLAGNGDVAGGPRADRRR